MFDETFKRYLKICYNSEFSNLKKNPTCSNEKGIISTITRARFTGYNSALTHTSCNSNLIKKQRQ